MPNKTIYVADPDAPMFRRAQELAGGNLSSAISQALRRFVEIKEAHVEGYEEIEVHVGSDGVFHRKRFIGRLVAQWQRREPDGRRGDHYAIYQTKKGRFVAHIKRIAPPDQESGTGGFPAGRPVSNNPESMEYWENVSNPESWTGWGIPSDASFDFQVFENLDELKTAVPDELFSRVETGSKQKPVEDLDI